MANNRIVWSGLEELKQQFRSMPAELTNEASGIVDRAGEYAKSSVIQGYPRRTGDLRNHVTLTHFENGKFGAGSILKNTAKHAWLFENGSQARHNDLGANRGAMPPGHVFVPAVIRWRKWMYGQLKDMLVRSGLTVTGDV